MEKVPLVFSKSRQGINLQSCNCNELLKYGLPSDLRMIFSIIARQSPEKFGLALPEVPPAHPPEMTFVAWRGFSAYRPDTCNHHIRKPGFPHPHEAGGGIVVRVEMKGLPKEGKASSN